MKDPILLNKMWREVEAGRVTVSQSGSLSLFKYTQDTHIKDEWNDVNRQARGIIFDVDGRVVARPFNKFFNLNERPETSPQNLPWSEDFEVYEKMDGSCGIGYFGAFGPKGLPAREMPRWSLATPGSMESDQAIEGTKMLYGKVFDGTEIVTSIDGNQTETREPFGTHRYNLAALPQDCTPVFEIIYPDNRIVVDYKGERKLVLLAIFEHNGVEWHPRRVDQIAQMCGFPRPKLYELDLRDDIPFEDNSEGYVCRFDNGFRVKVKSPTYLRIHRILNHLSPKGIVELIRGKEYRAVIEQLPKEIARDFDDIRAHVQGMHNRILTDAHENLNRMLECQSVNAPRKQHAIWISNNVANAESGFVFALLDGKDIEDKIWKLVLENIKDEV